MRKITRAPAAAIPARKAGARALGPPRLDQRLEPRHAAADNAQVRLNGDPRPQMGPFPRDVVRLPEDDVEVVDADGGSDDDEQADAEECDDGEPLDERQVSVVDGWQRQHPDEEVKDNG